MTCWCSARLGVHQKRWKFRGSVCDFLWNGNSQHAHVWESNCCNGKAKCHARGPQLSCISINRWRHSINGKLFIAVILWWWLVSHWWNWISLKISSRQHLKIQTSAYFQLHDFAFDDLNLDDDGTLKACLRMFLDLDLVERFHIDYEMLCRWLLSVKKNYRNVTYHNWRHAFNVAQMMFAILTTTQWWKVFGEIECLALVIGCLCHDLDHRGTNNSFQIK